MMIVILERDATQQTIIINFQILCTTKWAQKNIYIHVVHLIIKLEVIVVNKIYCSHDDGLLNCNLTIQYHNHEKHRMPYENMNNHACDYDCVDVM